MHCLVRVFIALLCGLYGLLWVGFDYDDLRRILSGGEYFTEKKDVALGLSDDVFDKCTLVSGPVWTAQLRKWLKPNYDPMKKCNRSYAPWSTLDADGRVRLTDAWDEEAECRARAVLFKSEYKVTLGRWKEIREEFVFENDMVEVECTIDDEPVYKFVHTQIWRGNTKKKKPKSTAPSVHIIVLDSIGSSHGKRVFNQTHRYLKEEFGAVEMHHVNKVGENSRPNGIAFLFGKLISNIKRDIYGLPSIPADWNYKMYCKTYFDDKGFILAQYKKSGYVTMMAEDWAKGVFNWPGCNGFAKQPTTHYMRPFQLHVRDSGKLMKSIMGKSNCFEPHLYLNDYHEKFINAYSGQYVPKVTLTWASELGHDLPDEPFHGDAHYKQFFERNKKEFDNSFVFFMGDHGLRFGWYSRDPIGQRDNNNPMLMISVPRKLRKDPYLMKNLEKNSGELLTQFDTHATFVDIVETFTRKGPTNFNETIVKPELMGSSILRPLPEPRNCKTLPIPPTYCLCEMQKEKLNVTDQQYFVIGQTIAAAANDRIAEGNISDVCAALEFDKLITLNRIVGADDLYDVTVQLRPGGGIFSTFVRGAHYDYTVVVPNINRVNKYGKDGDCTTINEIRPLCYCKSNLQKLSSPRPSTQRPKR